MKHLTLTGVFAITLLTGFPVHAGEMINKHLPSWLKMDLEVRHRLEWKENFDFNDAVNDDDTINLFRTRVNIAVTPIEQVTVFTQFQDARVWDQEIGSKAPNEDYADWRQGYIELKKFIDSSGAMPDTAFRFGRQELSYGAQRVLGGFNWSNLAQTFDAGKVMLNFEEEKFSIDGFGGSRSVIETPRDYNSWFDNSTKDKMGGYYATYKGIENQTLEQYFITRLSDARINFGPNGTATTDVHTIGGRAKGKIGTSDFDYELEAAKQWGEFGTLDVDAQMAVAIIGYTFTEMGWKPRASFEFDYASGDSDHSDGELNTFNNLYPTNHLHYGYMDRAALQNLMDYRLQLAVKPHAKVDLSADWHMLYLDTSKDSLYAANRAPIRTAGVAGADDHIGNELDLLAKIKPCNYLSMQVGYSHFFAGEFLDDSGAQDDADFFYVESTISF